MTPLPSEFADLYAVEPETAPTNLSQEKKKTSAPKQVSKKPMPPPPKAPTAPKSTSKQQNKELSNKKDIAPQTHSDSKRPRPSESPSFEATSDPFSNTRRGTARIAMAQIKSAMDAELITSDVDEEEEKAEQPKKDRRFHTRLEPRPHPSRSRS